MEEYLVQNAPAFIYYIADFINTDEEDYLIRRVIDAPKPKWEYLSNRRLQNYGGIIGKSGGLIVADDIPKWLQFYVDKVAKFAKFPASNQPNHVLINEYLAGQGILPHEDGPAFYPLITTISLGSHTLLDFYSKISDDDTVEQSRFFASVLLERRSLVIIGDQMYFKFLHSIAERSSDNFQIDKNGGTVEKVLNFTNLNKLADGGDKSTVTLDRSTRISLTIRNVPKLSRLNINSLFKQ